MESNSNSKRTRGTSELALGRRNTLSRLRSFLAVSSKVPKNPAQIRWGRRWTVASGAWFVVPLAVLFGGIDWQAGLMVAATAFMLARGGDMLDQHDE